MRVFEESRVIRIAGPLFAAAAVAIFLNEVKLLFVGMFSEFDEIDEADERGDGDTAGPLARIKLLLMGFELITNSS